STQNDTHFSELLERINLHQTAISFLYYKGLCGLPHAPACESHPMCSLQCEKKSRFLSLEKVAASPKTDACKEEAVLVFLFSPVLKHAYTPGYSNDDSPTAQDRYDLHGDASK